MCLSRRIELPYNIGDTIYVVERYDESTDSSGVDYYHLGDGNKVCIMKREVHEYIVSEHGVLVSEETWDGYQPIDFYQDYASYDHTMSKQLDFVFGNHFEAVSRIKEMSRGNELNVDSDKDLNREQREKKHEAIDSKIGLQLVR